MLILTCLAGVASAQVTVDGRRNEPGGATNPYGAPLALQRSTNISFENAPRVTMTFQSDQSNVAGKGAYEILGTASAPEESDPDLVATGVEFSVILADIGMSPIPPNFKIAGFVNGSGHDFASNQFIGGFPNDPGNLGEPRNINLATLPGDQSVTIDTTVRSGAAPTIDGLRNEAAYVILPHVTLGTGFGSSNMNPAVRNRANGSEINGVAAYIYNNATPGIPGDDVLVFHVAGNLESNFNKLEIFIDFNQAPLNIQGQNVLEDDNPNVSFNGLNRMGRNTAGENTSAPGVLGPGLTFETGFTADEWISITVGGNTPPTAPDMFIDSAVLLGAGGGPGLFGGQGPNLAAAGTPAVVNLATQVAGPPVGSMTVDIDNSNSDAIVNSGGVGGRVNLPGSGSQPDVSPPAGVVSGFEFKINLDGIGYPVGTAGSIRIAGAILGFNFDYMSNQAIGGLTSTGSPDPSNLGFPAQNVDLTMWDGDQFVTELVPLSLVSAPAGAVINGVMDAAEMAAYGTADWVNTTNASAFGDSIASGTFTPGPNRSNGSELNAVYFYVATDPTDMNKPKLYGLVTGNLHDFNKLILFFDTKAGGQNDIRADNASIDGNRFNTGLGGVDGFQFDAGFEADYAISYTAGFDTNLLVARHFADGVQLNTLGGGYGGRFGGGDKTGTSPPVTGTIIAREGFGNNDLSGVNPPGAIRTVNANGSELAAVYARAEPDGAGGGTLFMFFAGNLEPASVNIELFFDTRAGQGQNTLIYSDRSPQDPLYTGNPDVDFGALNRMGGPVLDMNMMVINEGMRFDAGFEPDYYFSYRALDFDPSLQQVTVFGNWARLRTLSDPVGPMPADAGRYLGNVQNDAFDSFGPAFLNGSQPEPISAAALANNNTGGVPGGLHFFCPGTGGSDPAAVLTGFEVAIDLADLGYGNGPGQVFFTPGVSPLNFAVFLNGTGHGKVANQMLQHGCVDDLGEPRDVDFQAIQGNQYVGFPAPVPAPALCVAPTLNGDANHDGVVSFADVTAVLANFGAMYTPGSGGTGDANNDGVVNFADVTAILANFGAMGLTC
jgi:hypothetical protein